MLQGRPGITARELAEHLGVVERTARRDVAHLRDLGYRVGTRWYLLACARGATG